MMAHGSRLTYVNLFYKLKEIKYRSLDSKQIDHRDHFSGIVGFIFFLQKQLSAQNIFPNIQLLHGNENNCCPIWF